MTTLVQSCPQCNGNNFKITEHNSFGYCFNCGHTERGDTPVETIIESEHIDIYRQLYKEAAQYYHSCLQEAHRQYLNRRGITDRTIQERKIGYCPKDTTLLYKHHLSDDSGMTSYGKPTLANRIVFPYMFDDMIVDLRGRIFGSDGEKYKSLTKSAKYRGAMSAYNIDMHDDTIIITEGEIKSIIPAQYGYAVHGLPGILSNRVIARKPYTKAIIMFDSQKNMRDIHRAIQRIAKRVFNPFVATLQLRGKEKQDIDSYINDYGIEAFDVLIRNALEYDKWEKIHGYA